MVSQFVVVSVPSQLTPKQGGMAEGPSRGGLLIDQKQGEIRERGDRLFRPHPQ